MSKMGDSHKIIDILREHFIAGGKPLHTGIECGCHRGELSAKLLREFPSLMLAMVDSWDSHPPDSPYRESGDSLARLTFDQQSIHMKAAEAATEFAAIRRLILRIPSVVAAKRVPFPAVSFVFLDGGHDLENVRADIAAWWPRVEGGGRGILAGHDFAHKRYPGVRIAVEEFMDREQVEVRTIGSCWYAVKVKAKDQLPTPPTPPSLEMGTQLV